MPGGVYQEYGDIRRTALTMALDNLDRLPVKANVTKNILAQAEEFFHFLIKNDGSDSEKSES